LRRSSKAGGHWALIFIALLFPLQAIAIQVPAEYQGFIKTAKKPVKPMWKRLCEQFNVCEMSAADISVALVIGVSKYQYLTSLESTQNDARELADFLLDSGEFEQVILLTEADATKRAIEYFMEDYIPTLLQGRRQRSRFLFYFSGHGERRPGTGRGYLRLANNPKHAYSQSIGMDEVHAWANFNTKNAIHSLFLIDACMSGIVGQQIMGEARFDIRRHPADLIKQSAGILITAGTEGQKTHAGPYWRGSLFNAVLLHGLRGEADRPPSDGVITSQELFAYLESAVSHESHQMQTPRRWVLRKFQSGDFFFLVPTRSKRPKPEHRLPPGTETMGRVAVDVINREYSATVNVRVRRGPGTRYKVLKTLKRGERVLVTGKVKNRNWYQVKLGTGVAYIFARLLEPVTATNAAPDLDRLSTIVQRIKQLQLEIEKLWAEAPKLPPADLPELDAHMGELGKTQRSLIDDVFNELNALPRSEDERHYMIRLINQLIIVHRKKKDIALEDPDKIMGQIHAREAEKRIEALDKLKRRLAGLPIEQ
jgi:uncharacterized protein YgiM (DUF1202 family)